MLSSLDTVRACDSLFFLYFYDGITFSRMRSICGVHGERDALGDDENYMLLLSSPLPTPSSISQNNRSHHDHLCG
jgi:hypothetical protein